MNLLWKITIPALFMLLSITSYAERDNEQDEFEQHKAEMIKGEEEKIQCFREAGSWDDIEDCHHQMEKHHKQKRLEELEEEQQRLREELEEIENEKD